jgi:hypothetical protein
MTCRELLDRVDAVAAGDEPATAELREHLEGCVSCAAALADARRIEMMLTERPAPSAPAGFTAAVQSHIREARWRSEQHVDHLFNAALVMAVIAIVLGGVALFNVNAMTAAFAEGLALLQRVSGPVVVQAAPKVATYLGAAGFLATALFVWWWAERRLSL